MSAYTVEGLVEAARGANEEAKDKVEATDDVWAACAAFAFDRAKNRDGIPMPHIVTLADTVVTEVRAVVAKEAEEAAESKARAAEEEAQAAKEAEEAAEAKARAAEEEAQAERKAAAYAAGSYVGNFQPQGASELAHLFAQTTAGWTNNPQLYNNNNNNNNNNSTPPRTRQSAAPDGPDGPSSTVKDSGCSSSSQGNATGLHGFQRTARHALVVVKWDLDYERLVAELASHLGVDLAEWVEAWVAGARLIHVSRDRLLEVRHTHGVLGMWLFSAVFYLFGDGIQVSHEGDPDNNSMSSTNQVEVEVPVFTNDAWASLTHPERGDFEFGSGDPDTNNPIQKKRSGCIDFVVHKTTEEVLERAMAVEAKAPIEPSDEKKKNPHEGQLMIEVAGLGPGPGYGMLTDGRYRVNLAYSPGSIGPKPWVRRGTDAHEQNAEDKQNGGYIPIGIAMSDARIPKGHTCLSDAPTPFPHHHQGPEPDGFDEVRARWAGMGALIGLGLALLPDWDPKGVRSAAEAAVTQGVENVQARLVDAGWTHAPHSNEGDDDVDDEDDGDDGDDEDEEDEEDEEGDGGGKDETDTGAGEEKGQGRQRKSARNKDRNCKKKSSKSKSKSHQGSRQPLGRQPLGPIDESTLNQNDNDNANASPAAATTGAVAQHAFVRRVKYLDEHALTWSAPPLQSDDRVRAWLAKS